MARTPSGRKDRGEPRSGPDLLTPLPATEHPEATMPADIHSLIEVIEELKVLVASPPQSAASHIEALEQATQNLSSSMQALRTDLDQREEGHAGIITEIFETQTAVLKGLADLAAALEVGEAIRGALDLNARELRDSRQASERLTRSNQSINTELARLASSLKLANAPGHDLAALDAWRDDFIRHVSALLARVEKEAGVPATDAGASGETTLAHVDRITARMSLLEGEVGKATMKMDEVSGTVTTSLTEHGETMRRAEGSNLLTRKQVEFLHTAFNREEREYRRMRHLWVSLPVILIVALAGMVLESRLHWFYRLLG